MLEKLSESSGSVVGYKVVGKVTPADYQKFLKAAGYETIEIHEVVDKNWIAAVGSKAELPSEGSRNVSVRRTHL